MESFALYLLLYVTGAKSFDLHRPVRRCGALQSSSPDAGMADIYESLAARAAAAAAALPSEAQWWCGIAGGPGAGKSTLAEKVAEACERLHGIPAVVLPMDGFHYSKKQLCELDPPSAESFLARRGAPHTFDAEGFHAALVKAKREKAAKLPTYSRALSDPVEGGSELEPYHRVVLVEGNYLLLGALEEGALGVDTGRWAPLQSIFDETWFVAPPGGVSEQRRRLISRHLENWSDAKTKMWGAETAEEGAAKRTDFNDVHNAELVDLCRGAADLAIESI